MERPSMQQDGHPEHNMPVPEHDGTVLTYSSASGKAAEMRGTGASKQMDDE